MQSMQIARLRAGLLEFAYVDSGAPISSNYTTLVCVHGHTYHAQTFSRLLPIARRHNLRVIAFNRRDYVGSTPFSTEELEALGGDDDQKHVSFLRARGLEIAQFLVWVIDELKIVPVGANKKSGGLALLGWSLGNVSTLAFLRHIDSYPRDVVDILNSHLNAFFIYESTDSFLGFPTPNCGYHPLFDSEVSGPNKAEAIDRWFTAYFSHPYCAASCEPNSHPPRDIAALELRTPTSPNTRSTRDNRSQEELVSIIDVSPGMRSEIAFFTDVKHSTLYEQFVGALTLGDGSDLSTKVNQNLRIFDLYGMRSVWVVLWAAWEAEKDVERLISSGKHVRPIKFVPIEGANHFLLWDDPELFLRSIAVCIGS